ncbi:MAG: LamG domain-containing protein [bacterium]|nr:LamG domain-containing protein [bacterium]
MSRARRRAAAHQQLDDGGDYVANNGVDCILTGDYVSIDSTAWTNTKSGIISMWAYVTDVTSTRYLLSNNGHDCSFIVSSTEKLTLRLEDAPGATIVNLNSAAAVVPLNEWCHLAACWDLANQVAKGFVNGSLVVSTASAVNAAPNWSQDRIGVGAQGDGGGRSTSYVQEVYANLSGYLNLDGPNMDLFYNPGTGKPVGLGATGNLPTGGQPEIYLNNAYGTFNINKGSKGNFTNHGVLDGSAVGSPSD